MLPARGTLDLIEWEFLWIKVVMSLGPLTLDLNQDLILFVLANIYFFLNNKWLKILDMFVINEMLS